MIARRQPVDVARWVPEMNFKSRTPELNKPAFNARSEAKRTKTNASTRTQRKPECMWHSLTRQRPGLAVEVDFTLPRWNASVNQ